MTNEVIMRVLIAIVIATDLGVLLSVEIGQLTAERNVGQMPP